MMGDVPVASQMSGHRYGDIVINDGTSHFGDVHNFVQNVGISAEEQHRKQIMSSLRFPEMNFRWNDITDSEFARYEWFFHDERDQHDGFLEHRIARDWPSLRIWLQQPLVAYIVQGKPGSGKSTFMKFISQHQITSTLLQQWASPNHVRLMFHSFWLVGTRLQNSMRGFLASLVYRIMEEEESAADIIYQAYPNKYHLNDWSEKELSSLLFSTLRASKFYYCIFVDGLDEFDANDDPDRISEVLHELLSFTNCKLCLSTRPIPHILDRWQNQSILKLHDLTSNDISVHVVGVLEQKSHRVATGERKKHLIRELAAQICSKADGVFLWVHYVLATICSGIRARDDLISLEKRIALLPSDISDLYRTMWEKQNLDNEIHAQESAACFRLVLKYPRQPLLHTAMRLDPTLLNEYAERMESLGKERIETILSHCAELLHIRSAGLIECRSTPLITPNDVRKFYRYDDLVRADSYPEDGVKNLAREAKEVQFIHRSVYDFLKQTTFGKSLLVLKKTNFVQLYDPSVIAFNDFICHLTSIIERHVTATIFRRSDWLIGLRQIDGKHIDMIDSVYKDMVSTISSKDSSTDDWVLRLVQLGIRDPGYGLDFSLVIMQSYPSEQGVSHLLESRGKSWTRYYMGHLVAQVVHRRPRGPNVLHYPSRALVERGADLASLQVFAQYGGIFFVRCPAVEILSWLFGLMYTCPEDTRYSGKQGLLSQAQLRNWLDLIKDQLKTSTKFSMFLPLSLRGLACLATYNIDQVAAVLVFDTWETYRLLSSMVSNMGSGFWTLEDSVRLEAQSKTLLRSVCVVDVADPDEHRKDYFRIHRLDHTLFEKFRTLSIERALQVSQRSISTWNEFYRIRDAAIADSCTVGMSDAPDIVFGCMRSIQWIPTSTEHIRKPQKFSDAWKPCRRILDGESTPWQERILFTPTDEEKQQIEYVNREMQRRLDLASGPVEHCTTLERHVPIWRPWEPRVHGKPHMGQGPYLMLSKASSSDRSTATQQTTVDDENLLDEID